jgi:hypothetical protein
MRMYHATLSNCDEIVQIRLLSVASRRRIHFKSCIWCPTADSSVSHCTLLVHIGRANRISSSLHLVRYPNPDRTHWQEQIPFRRRGAGQHSSARRRPRHIHAFRWRNLALTGIWPPKSLARMDGFTLRVMNTTDLGCDLKNPEFACPSACHMTVGDKESPDEVIYLRRR